MKRFFTALVLACMTLFAVAQNSPSGMRMEIAEVGENDNEYSIFTYKDDNGDFGYYLGLGHVYRILEVDFGFGNASTLDHIDETCIYLGATADEAYTSLENMLAMLDNNPGTAVDIPCRMTNGVFLTDSSMATCIVVKRFFQRKRLCFHFVSGPRTAEADLTRSAIKSLRWNLKVAQKVHLAD